MNVAVIVPMLHAEDEPDKLVDQKWVAFFVAILLGTSLAACGGGSDSSTVQSAPMSAVNATIDAQNAQFNADQAARAQASAVYVGSFDAKATPPAKSTPQAVFVGSFD